MIDPLVYRPVRQVCHAFADVLRGVDNGDAGSLVRGLDDEVLVVAQGFDGVAVLSGVVDSVPARDEVEKVDSRSVQGLLYGPGARVGQVQAGDSFLQV